LPGTGNCRAALTLATDLCKRRRDNFLSFAFQASKKGALCKSPAKSHFVPNRRENALAGVASFRKKQRPSLEPFAAV
jgi:hypothetical protein